MLLSDSLSKINAAINSKLTSFQDKGIHGLTVLKDTDGKTSPYERKEDGEGVKISPDDTYDLQIYYRETGNSTEANPATGFGNNLQRRVTHRVDLVALVSSSFYDLDSWVLSNEISKCIPNFLSKGEFANIVSTNSDTVDVLNEEFRGHDIDHLLLEINAIKISLEIIKIYC